MHAAVTQPSSIREVPEATTPRAEDTFIRGYRQLALETPARPRDVVLRLLDVLLSSLFLILTLPLVLPITLIVLLMSGRPVFYRGERVGRGGRVFTMFKFRTLRSDAETRLGPYLGEELVRRTQEEFTGVGRWLKATQLDEVPQFINVLRGDMSLVGPRPIRPVFFEELARELPACWQHTLGADAVRVWVPWRGEARPVGARLVELARTEQAARQTRVVLAVFGFARDTPATSALQARFCSYARSALSLVPDARAIVV